MATAAKARVTDAANARAAEEEAVVNARIAEAETALKNGECVGFLYGNTSLAERLADPVRWGDGAVTAVCVFIYMENQLP